jgi:hypothetical protein
MNASLVREDAFQNLQQLQLNHPQQNGQQVYGFDNIFHDTLSKNKIK